MFWHRRKRARLHWVTDDIAFAPKPASGDWPLLHDEGVRCVVDLRDEAASNAAEVEQHQLCYLRLPIVEGEAASQDDLRLLVAWIDEHMNEHGPVLVHCREGRGRSPMVVLASLVNLGIPLSEGYQLVKRANPAVALNNSQEAALMRFAEGMTGLREGGT